VGLLEEFLAADSLLAAAKAASWLDEAVENLLPNDA